MEGGRKSDFVKAVKHQLSRVNLKVDILPVVLCMKHWVLVDPSPVFNELERYCNPLPAYQLTSRLG